MTFFPPVRFPHAAKKSLDRQALRRKLVVLHGREGSAPVQRPRVFPPVEAADNRVSQEDVRFFSDHPERTCRVRFALPSEMADYSLAAGDDIATPPGYRHFVAVSLLRDGTHKRHILLGRDTVEPETCDEKKARSVYRIAEARALPKAEAGRP